MFYKSKVAIFLSSNRLQNPSKFQIFRTFVDNVDIKFVSDRALDHAVERERDLKCLINLKNLLKLEPSKSLPISTIVDNNETLKIPFRPIEFIRRYPSVFEEFFPANLGIHPHVRLTPKSLDLEAEEQLIFDSDTFKKNAADRLLKLLMLCRVNKLPLKLIDQLKWDLGLPDNYVKTLVPEFPDYFQVKKGKGFKDFLELVCWSDDLAVSAVEKMAKKSDKDYQKGMPIEYLLNYSKGFVSDKKFKKWIDEWQKLPYMSPYENFVHLQPNSDMSDRWAVAVVHEFLNILVPKKTERENLLCYGEYLRVKPRLKRAIGHHPGIFYVSSKLGTYTVVLKEAYERGLLIDKDPLVDMRSKYMHLMHNVNAVQKPKDEKKEASKETSVGGVVEKGNVENEKVEFVDLGVSESDEDESDVRGRGRGSSEEDEEDEEENEVEDGRGRGRGRSGRRGSSEVNAKGGESIGNRRGRGGVGKSNEEDRGRGGGRSGKRGFDKVNEEGRERGGSKNGRREFNMGNDVGNERGGGRDERKGFSMRNAEGEGRRGVRSEGRGFRRGNEEGQERGGFRSEGKGFKRGNGERQERGGFRSEGRGFRRGNEEGQVRSGFKSEGRGFRRGDEEGQGRGGFRSNGSGFRRGNGEGQERGGSRGGRGGFNRANGEGQERGGSRGERGGFNRANEEHSRNGHARGGYKSGSSGSNKMVEGERNRRSTSERTNSPRRRRVDA